MALQPVSSARDFQAPCLYRTLFKFQLLIMPADYHMHTPLCHHAVGQPVDYARVALSRGLKEIGFSDHSPMPRDDWDDWRMFERYLDTYVQSVRKAQETYPELTIKL